MSRLKQQKMMIRYYGKQRDAMQERVAIHQLRVQSLEQERDQWTETLNSIAAQIDPAADVLAQYQQCELAAMRCQHHIDQILARIRKTNQELDTLRQALLEHDRRAKSWEKLLEQEVERLRYAEFKTEYQAADERYLANRTGRGTS
ncbi:MAG TPA: hypothetical protein PKD54_16180 [Pirellulaceae bacterium]|nr:hypothetical protein [Pirellulaceae bacterium]